MRRAAVAAELPKVSCGRDQLLLAPYPPESKNLMSMADLRDYFDSFISCPFPLLLSLADPLKYKLVLIIYILMGTGLVLKAI